LAQRNIGGGAATLHHYQYSDWDASRRITSSRTVVSEADFHEFAQCGLRLYQALASYAEPALIQAASRLWKWLSTRSADRQLPTLKEVRSYYPEAYKGLSLTREEKRQVVVSGVRVCRRLYDLAVKHTVIQPVTCYQLPLARASVAGEYAIVRRIGQRAQPCIVRLQLGDIKKRETERQPDLINMVRWVHADRFSGLPGVKVLNWSVDLDCSWEESYCRVPTESMVGSVALSIGEERMFPTSGAFFAGMGSRC